MNRSKLGPAGLLLAMVGALAGCGSPVNTVEPAHPAAEPNPLLVTKVVFSSALEGDVRIESVIEAKREDLLMIQATVTNVSGDPFQLGYRYEWFDEEGMLVTTPTSTWIPRQMEEGESIALVGVAPAPRAVDFRLKLQELD